MLILHRKISSVSKVESVRELVLISESDSKTFDNSPLTCHNVTIDGDGLAEGDTISYSFTGSQKWIGSSENTFTYSISNVSGTTYNVTQEYGTLTVMDDDVDDALIVEMTAEGQEGSQNETQYRLEDTVTFEISVRNPYADTQTITLSEIEGVILAQSIFENVAGGQSVSTTATYTVTEADILNGSFTNTVTVDIGNIAKSTECTILTEEQNPHLTVTLEETSSPANGESYAIDETVQWTITVLNDGNISASGYGIFDLTGEEAPIFTNLAPGQTASAPIEYIVQETDLELEEIVCEASAYVEDNGDYPFEIETDESSFRIAPIEIDPENAVSIDVEASDEPANTKTYAFEETIDYEVTITNTTSLTLMNITLSSDLTGDNWTFAYLAPGESRTLTASSIVTEADILAGQVVCEFVANGEIPDSDNSEFASSVQFISYTESPNPSLSVTLVETINPANNISYALGEEILYKATITNNGNLTITDIETVNETTGNGNSIASLAPGASEEFERPYVVKESDILNGSAIVTETATGTSPDPDNPEIVSSGTCENAVDEPVSHLTLSIIESSSPANNTAYAVGETINYVIDGTNDGNLTIDNLVVTAYFNGSFVGSWTIDYLNPGYTIARRNYYYSPLLEEHAVIPEDIVAGEAVMSVNATGTMPNNYTLQVQEAKCPSLLEDAS